MPLLKLEVFQHLTLLQTKKKINKSGEAESGWWPKIYLAITALTMSLVPQGARSPSTDPSIHVLLRQGLNKASAAGANNAVWGLLEVVS